MNEAKPFAISKWEVWEAYKRVKANQGAAGVDEQSIAVFERDLKGNLYKIWNRMSSGSYFPSPVRTGRVEERRGARPTGSRSFPLPAHQTGRADFPHPAFRLDFITKLTNEMPSGLDAVEQRPTGRRPHSARSRN